MFSFCFLLWKICFFSSERTCLFQWLVYWHTIERGKTKVKRCWGSWPQVLESLRCAIIGARLNWLPEIIIASPKFDDLASHDSLFPEGDRCGKNEADFIFLQPDESLIQQEFPCDLCLVSQSKGNWTMAVNALLSQIISRNNPFLYR